ncbi:MAG: SDR family oxidoreductase [Actinomycetia bacterium]|nr:SDR family oxidoreductase [Actinomycetes bacterium]
MCSDIRREAREGGYEGDIRTPTGDVIRANGGKAAYIDTDAADHAAMENLVNSAASRFGKLDVMVTTWASSPACTPSSTRPRMGTTRRWPSTARVGLGCKFAIGQMLAAEPAYCAAKGAVVNLTRQLAVDFAPERINMNAICPGFLATAMVRPFLDDPELNKVLHDKSPWPELGTAQDVANAAVYLSTTDARWVTGTMLTVDGGFTSA